MKINLLIPNQSGFTPTISCIRQLISVTHEMYAPFDFDPSLEVRGIFYMFLKIFIECGMKGLFVR